MTGLHVHLEIPEDNLTLMEEYSAKKDGPIVMVNLMKVREAASYKDTSIPSCSGYEAFERYSRESAAVRTQAQAELI